MKVGDIVVVKTSGERVLVLRTGGESVTVRRPVLTDKGVVHLTEEFLPIELETALDNMQRQMKDMAQFQAEKQALTGPDDAQPGLFVVPKPSTEHN